MYRNQPRMQRQTRKAEEGGRMRNKQRKRLQHKIQGRKCSGTYAVLLTAALAVALLWMLPAQPAQAGAITTVKKKQNLKMKTLTSDLQKRLPPPPRRKNRTVTSSSAIRRPGSPRPACHRGTLMTIPTIIIFLRSPTRKAQKRPAAHPHKVQRNREYTVEYMTLKRFGHGTNLDCAQADGVTWLWTGSNAAAAAARPPPSPASVSGREPPCAGRGSTPTASRSPAPPAGKPATVIRPSAPTEQNLPSGSPSAAASSSRSTI